MQVRNAWEKSRGGDEEDEGICTSMTKDKIKNLRIAIIGILQENVKARDSDQYLTIMVWMKYYPESIVELQDGSKAVKLRDVMILPREDNVKRIRAKIQNEEGMYLPTSMEVARKRGINEEVWKAYALNNY